MGSRRQSNKLAWTMILLRFFAAIATAGCCWLVAYLAADRLLRGTEITIRIVGGLCLGYWLAAWSFEALGLLGGFRLAVIVPVLLVAPMMVLIVGRKAVGEVLAGASAELREELRGLWQALRSHRWVTVALGLIGAHVLIRMVRALATPSFGWDDFTYHLFRAGRWVQNAGLDLEPAPDAWTAYEFFPWGGDLVWGWALVWRVTDVLVPVGAIALWCTVLTAAYAVARELGQDRATSLIVAVALAVLPSQASQLNTAYVDNAVLAMVLVASLFLLVLLRDPGASASGAGTRNFAAAASFFIGAACGVGLMVKMSFLPLLAVAVVIVTWRALRSRRIRDLVACIGGAVVVAPNLAFNWIHRGSPFYPFRIIESWPYDAQHAWILGKYGEGATPAELIRAGKALLVNIFPLDPFLNIGFLGLVLLVFGVVGSARLARTSRGRWFLIWVVTGAVMTMLSFFSPRNSSMIVFWTIVMGRFLVPSLAGLLVASGLVGATLVRRVIVPTMLMEYFLYAPHKWPMEIAVATLQVAAMFVVVVAAGAYLRRRDLQRPIRWMLLALMLTVTLSATTAVRERVRFDAYRLHGERRLFDWHGVPYIEAWPIWQWVEQAGASRIAVTAGWDGLTGHNWFRWPFLGARLQNEVVYLPITKDGSLVSYIDPGKVVIAADRDAWLARLQENEIDLVAALGPANIEHTWIFALPDIFKIEITMMNNNFVLARVDREELERYLAASR